MKIGADEGDDGWWCIGLLACVDDIVAILGQDRHKVADLYATD